MSNIHERIIKELKSRKHANPSIARKIDEEIAYENGVAHHSPQGIWVLTDFGLHIDPTNDIGLKLPKNDKLKWQTREKYEKRGATLINTKVPHVLASLRMYDGGASTCEMLEKLWFTTSNEFYGTLDNLVVKGRGKKRKVSSSNKTLGYFKELLRWPTLQPAVELVKYEPGPEKFQRFAHHYESLRDIVKSAIKYGFKVSFVEASGKNAPYYAITLPETMSDRKSLQYDPTRSSHYAILELAKKGLAAKLQLGETDWLPVTTTVLEQRINDYGQRYFKQKVEAAGAYRRRIGLEKLV